jgi:hypothetical protein
MTSPESPSALLERAAKRVEELACAATAGPWEARDRWVEPNVAALTGASMAYGEVEYEFLTPGNAAWIATLNPSVATPLVAWLRDSAASCQEHDEDIVANGRPGDYCPNENQALDFARIILGESS